MWSDSEALLWTVDKVITNIDWSGTFTFYEKSRILSDLGMTADQFLDLGLLAGCSLCRTFPPIADTFSIRSAIDLIRQYKTGIVTCQAWRESPAVKASNYGEVFMRARLAVKYSLILTTEGACVPLPLVVPPPNAVITPADIPSDLDEIFSPRLPDELYFFICRGMVAANLVGYLATGVIDERQPLADSPEYRRFIKDIITEGATSPRCTTLALLSACLHPHWASKRIVGHPLLTRLTHSPLTTTLILPLHQSWALLFPSLIPSLNRSWRSAPLGRCPTTSSVTSCDDRV